jgi:N-methylhydantoinase B
MTELMNATDASAADTVRLRDLDNAGFSERYGCDRFTATVLTNRFRYIAQHMANEVRTHAFSPVIRDGSDLCAMVSGPAELEYPMVAVSETMPLYYGSIPNAVRIVIEEYGPEDLEPGDVVIVNDYYRVGTHLNDACLIRPIFLDDRIVGAITMRAHFLDMGGIVMGGFEATKRNTWEDGLRIPPTLLHHHGKAVKSTLKLLYDNTRLGFLCVPDLITEVRALEVGEQLLAESIQRYGLEAYTGAVRYACDASAEAMADALRSIPDGVYEGEDFLDGDGFPDAPELAVRVRITKVGDRAEVDLRETSPTSRGAVNGAWPDINTALVYAFKSVLDPHTPVTSGTLRNIDSVVGPDVLCNASPPTPCQLYFLVVFTMVHAVHQALNPVLGERAGAAGYVTGTPSAFEIGPDGVERTLYGAGGPMVIGAWGANRHGDADSSQQNSLGNIIDGGVEIFERNSQALWAASDYVPDSGGAGTYRGGAAILYDLLWLAPADHRMQLLFHSRRPPAGGGVNGGHAGPTTTAWLFDGDLTDGGTKLPELPTSLHGEFYRDATPYGGVIDPETGEADPDGRHIVLTERMPRSAGAVARVMNAAGGGWGDPWERDPALVCRDVRDEYVTFEGAARDYGVVVVGDLRHPEQISVDEAATRALRASRS